MYVSIRRYAGVTFPDTAAAKVREELCPLISKIQGFQEYYAIRDGDDAVVSVSVFANKPGADESVKAAATWVEEKLTQYLPNKPQVISGESFAHTMVAERKDVA